MKTGAHSVIEQCGCCDKRSVFARCEACNEPTCGECIRRIGPVGEASYLCVVCLEALEVSGREAHNVSTPALAEVLT